VSRHTFPHFGHCPPVSNVCQTFPHAHCQRASGGGSQRHFGQ
jgi:hypothetical protein